MTTKTNRTTTASLDEKRIAAEVAALLKDRRAFARAYYAGETPCGDCSVLAKNGKTCPTCGGSGKYPALSSWPIGWDAEAAADHLAGDGLRDAIDLLERFRVGRTQHDDGRGPQTMSDVVLPGDDVLLAELDRLVPLLARASVIAQMLADRHDEADEQDPRAAQYRARVGKTPEENAHLGAE